MTKLAAQSLAIAMAIILSSTPVSSQTTSPGPSVVVSSPTLSFSCGPHLTTYVVKPLDGRQGTGIRCVKFSEGKPGGPLLPKLAWYGEGNWNGQTYRHVGHAFYQGSTLLGGAADFIGNGETINNNFPFGRLKVEIASPSTIRVSGDWNEEWTRVASVNYQPLARPKTCGSNLKEFRVTDLTSIPNGGRKGLGLRCLLKEEHIPTQLLNPNLPLVKGVTTWFGNGYWGNPENTYSHLGTFSSNGYGASDICNPSFGVICNTFGWGTVKPNLSLGRFNVTGAWNEKWR